MPVAAAPIRTNTRPMRVIVQADAHSRCHRAHSSRLGRLKIRLQRSTGSIHQGVMYNTSPGSGINMFKRVRALSPTAISVTSVLCSSCNNFPFDFELVALRLQLLPSNKELAVGVMGVNQTLPRN
jgi:hypothetical protein